MFVERLKFRVPFPGYRSFSEEGGVEIPSGILPLEQHSKGEGGHRPDENVS